MTTISQLPPELMLNVFEHCSITTLLVSSLVSRQWREMTVPYRFRVIALYCNNLRDTPRGVDDVNVDMGREGGAYVARESTPKTLSTLLEFLTNTPGVPHGVRVLTIHLGPRDHIRVLPHTERETFFSICRTLPRLRELNLQEVFLPHYYSEAPVELRLDRLTIGFPHSYQANGTKIETIELLRMMTVFQSVKSLRLEQFRFGSSPDVISFPPQLGVTSLELRCVSDISIFLRSLRIGDAQQGRASNVLRELVIKDLRPSEHQEMNLCVNSVGSNLHHLGCCLPYEIRPPVSDTVLNLEPCRNLRSLTLYVKMTNYGGWGPRTRTQVWRYCHRVLSGLFSAAAPPTLDLLTLSIDFHAHRLNSSARAAVMDALPDISMVEKLLVTSIGRKMLRRVKIEMTKGLHVGAAISSADIPVIFPRLQYMGVLLF